MSIFSRWADSWRAAVNNRTSWHNDIWSYAGGVVPMTMLWFGAFMFFEYCTPTLAVQFPMYPKMLWGVFGLIVLFAYVSQVLQRADSQEHDLSHYMQCLLGYVLITSAFILSLGVMSGFLIAFVAVSSRTIFFFLLGISAFLGCGMGFFLPAWTYDGYTVTGALWRGMQMMGREWPALLVATLPYLPLAFIGQWVPQLVQAGYFVWLHPLVAHYVPLLAQSIWLMVGTAAFITVYKHRKDGGTFVENRSASLDDMDIQIITQDDDEDDNFSGEL